MKTIETKIGVNRGKHRVWIEGNNLALNGWQTGDRYTRQAAIDSMPEAYVGQKIFTVKGGE